MNTVILTGKAAILAAAVATGAALPSFAGGKGYVVGRTSFMIIVQ